jgi:hypothetical protein
VARRHGRPNIPPSTTRCQAPVQGRRLHQLLPKVEEFSPLFRCVIRLLCLKKIATCVAVCCRMMSSFISWPDHYTFYHYTISCSPIIQYHTTTLSKPPGVFPRSYPVSCEQNSLVHSENTPNDHTAATFAWPRCPWARSPIERKILNR